MAAERRETRTVRAGGISRPSQGARRPSQSGWGRRRLSTETRRSPETSEFWIYLAAVAGVLIASAVIDRDAGGDGDYFRADEAWILIVVLTVAYMLARGWAKSGTRELYWEDPDGDRSVAQKVSDAVTGGDEER